MCDRLSHLSRRRTWLRVGLIAIRLAGKRQLHESGYLGTGSGRSK
jgi:hypothetical protein